MAFDLEGIGMTSRRTRERLVGRLAEQGIHAQPVLDAIGTIPRHIFIDEALAHRAYEDTALPIGHGQTISQPFVVGLMTQTLLAHRPRRVLEIGTGCGYQTAVLASLVERVYSVERIGALSERARERLQALKMHSVRLRVGDGYQGWAEAAPFDAILVTAAPNEVPPALFEQLAEGGRLVVPVGGSTVQELRVIDRVDGAAQEETLEQVRFVPLVKGVARSR